jgi:hypothetical protein
MTKVGGRDVGTNDLGMMATGAVMLIDSFLPWYGVDFGFASVSVKGWSAGFLSWFAILLVIVVAGAVAARVFAGATMPKTGTVGPALGLLVLSGLASVLLVLRLLTHNDYTKFGLYLGLLLALGQAAFAFLAFRTSGEHAPAFGHGPTTAPPAA